MLTQMHTRTVVLPLLRRTLFGHWDQFMQNVKQHLQSEIDVRVRYVERHSGQFDCGNAEHFLWLAYKQKAKHATFYHY